jgi:hypothetical protein
LLSLDKVERVELVGWKRRKGEGGGKKVEEKEVLRKIQRQSAVRKGRL